MSLNKFPPGQYLGFTAWFNKTAVGGVIGKNELRSVLQRAGRDPTDGEIQEIIDSISVCSGGISFQAFIDYVCQYKQLRNVETEYREAFRIYDKSGTGQLTKEDITYVFERMRIKTDVDAVFAAVDTDRSGTIEYNEFVDAMGKTVL